MSMIRLMLTSIFKSAIGSKTKLWTPVWNTFAWIWKQEAQGQCALHTLFFRNNAVFTTEVSYKHICIASLQTLKQRGKLENKTFQSLNTLCSPNKTLPKCNLSAADWCIFDSLIFLLAYRDLICIAYIHKS